MSAVKGTGPSSIAVPIWRVGNRPQTPLPRYMTPGAAGCDLAAALEHPVTLRAGERALIPTGLGVALPPGFEAQVRPRSGLAVKTGLTVLNAPGTIDSDYRGEIQVALVHLGSEAVVVEHGDRIAQLVIAPVAQAVWEEGSGPQTGEGLRTERGAGGFGHTGVSAKEGRGPSSDAEK